MKNGRNETHQDNFDLDGLFGEFDLVKYVIRTQISELVPDGIIGSDFSIPPICRCGSWMSIDFWPFQQSGIELWTQDHNLFESSIFRQSLRMIGCTQFYYQEYMEGELCNNRNRYGSIYL